MKDSRRLICRGLRSVVPWRRRLAGQSMVESAMALVLVSFILFGMMQVLLKLNAEQIQQWAAYAAARGRVVGFNDSVIEKNWLIGNIINSGRMLAPSGGLTPIAQASTEQYAIPLFLQKPHGAHELFPQLNYESWESLPSFSGATISDQFDATPKQSFPLVIAQLIPLIEGAFGTTNATLQTTVSMENHFPFYMDY
ncbi:MAG: pilus assembly protein [Verrucomicrobiae bacterium]|nr:pilus assembly protein [Verrucomicrobiae bacterium]